jgi:serine/threonine protein kinase
MHSQSPPIAHRDIKIENIILKGKELKLCDFGSASIKSLFHSTANPKDIELEFEHYERFTTMMYRPPEMIDRFKKWNVGLKVDVWMLGCILFALNFFKHPFQEA